jgi:hypothetical protein
MAIDQNADFVELINEKLHPELMKNEVVNRTDIIKKISMDETWKGGDYKIAFTESAPSSIEFGGFTAETDVHEGDHKTGKIDKDDEKSLTGTLKFKHKDLITHDGKITEASFLKLLPNTLNEFADTIRMAIAQNFLNGKVLAKGTANGTAGGLLEVDRIERFRKGMKIQIEDADTALATYYVLAVDRSNLLAPKIKVSATRGGAAADISALTTASTGIKIYHPGQKANGFTSMKDILDPAVTTLWGLNKADYSFLQPNVFSGSDITAANILDKIFDYVTELQITAASQADEVWVSGRQFAAVLKQLEGEKKAYNVQPGSRKVSKYGWQEIQVGSVTGQLVTIVAVPEMDDTMMMIVNPKDFKFATNGFVRQVASPEGHKYYTVRTTSGWYFLVDFEVYGELVCLAPCKQAYVHSIPSPIAAS